MNGKTAKLIRKVALTAPYGNKGFDEEETKYVMRESTIMLAPGVRLTEKLLKKFYKQGKFTTEDLRQGLLSE
jgi:hypothetical protein